MKFRFTATDSFFTAKSKKTGPDSAQVLESYYVPTHLVLGAKTGVVGPPFPAAFKVQGRFPPESFLCRRPLPSTVGVFSDRQTRRVSRPLFRAGGEVGKLRGPAKGREETDYGRRGKKMTEESGKEEDDGRRERRT